MDTSAMVKKIALVAIGVIAVLLIVAAWRITRKCSGNDCRDVGTASAAETSLPPTQEPLTDDEVQECSRAFEEIGEAYPNLQFEKMQEIFCGISNKVARLGKERWDDIGSTLKMKFFGRLGDHVRHPLDFATAADFDRYMNANVAAARMIGFSLAANDSFNADLMGCDVIVFKVMLVHLKMFKDNGEAHLAQSAQEHLDAWKNYLASGQSLTRTYLRYQLKASLTWPRRQAEDMGMKSERDWVVYWRDYALHFHRQYFGVEPAWLDEEFPLEQNPDQR